MDKAQYNRSMARLRKYAYGNARQRQQARDDYQQEKAGMQADIIVSTDELGGSTYVPVTAAGRHIMQVAMAAHANGGSLRHVVEISRARIEYRQQKPVAGQRLVAD
jgi:predicted metal-dependent RNase